MVAFIAGQPEDALFQDRVAAVPQGKGKAENLPVIAQSTEAVLVPAINTRTRVLMRKEFPGLAEGAVILAHRSPGALAQIGTPPAPGHGPTRSLPQALSLR